MSFEERNDHSSGDEMSSIVLLSLPIGNLSDLSERARIALENGVYFICEDTRTLKSLMQHLGVDYSKKTFVSFHDYSTSMELNNLIKTIQNHDEVYLVSDAGNPLISDPGFPLVKKCLEEGIEVKSIPGVSAILVALELSGLPPFPFYFYGFYPQENNKQQEMLQKIDGLKGTHIFFEGTSRVEKTIDEVAHQFPDYPIVVARELTKKFESVYRFKGKEWKAARSQMTFKGEFVLLIHNDQEKMSAQSDLRKLAQEIMEEGARPKILAKLLSEILDRPVKEIYKEISKNNE